MKKLGLLFILVLIFMQAYSMPGRLLLIGGGTERSGMDGWNGQAFKWAVDQSGNKKVAFITYSADNATSWLPDHFLSDWGAVATKNFVINASNADAQATYDSLMNYDVIYFKGGDQAEYYSLYNNTLTEQAVLDKFNEGGVICGTSAGLAILGEVDFTALNGTVYPDEALDNWNNQYMTLADDFLNLFSGYIFDTHFVQRGRFARLLGFMAKWKFIQNEDITGIGLDDLTAMAIDTNEVGTVYGTGCANIYKNFQDVPFQEVGNHFVIDSIAVHQLLQGCSIDFRSGEISGFAGKSEPDANQEKGEFTLLISGSDNLVKNAGLLDNFITNTGTTSDPVLIFTGDNTSKAESFKSELINLGASSVTIYSVNTASSASSVTEQIESTTKFLFVDNNLADLMNLIDNSNVGSVLLERLKNKDVASAFIGDNSRFAGKTVITEYTVSGANYYAEMEFKPGLGLLETTTIMPYTYLNSDYFENTAAGVPYAMVKEDLAYGIWLTSDNYAKYLVKSEEIVLEPYGSMPVMVLRNRGTDAGFSTQTSTGGTSAPRQVAGFKQMNLSVIEGGLDYKLGEVEDTTTTPTYTQRISSSEIDILYGSENIKIQWSGKTFAMDVVDISGRIKRQYSDITNYANIRTNSLQTGIYIIRIKEKKTNKSFSTKIAIN